MCPCLEVLCIFPPTADIQVLDVTLDPIFPTCLPCLVSYEGPYTHLLNICRQPLKHLSLWGFHRRPGLCDPDALTKTLNSLAQRKSAERLTSLTVLVISITVDLLKSFSAFEYLEHLTVQSHERDFPENAMITPRFHITTLYDMIGTIALPSSLKSIKLLTRLGSDDGLPDQEHQVASFIQAFASQYQKVQRIDISYGIYWTGTYTAKWGRIRQTNDEILIPKEDSSPERVTESGGYSSKSSSNDCLLSTVISSVNPLPLGKLTFTEHRRMILFPGSAAAGSSMYHDFVSRSNGWMMNLWLRLKGFFGKNPA
ncbi:hypothetical protein BYT27DRAFT_6492840 [Phlegmacium glaucopus]|nr:hypothetical protein BYT27DRAFT_6492840 [Phlegmacium glaucopus]